MFSIDILIPRSMDMFKQKAYINIKGHQWPWLNSFILSLCCCGVKVYFFVASAFSLYYCLPESLLMLLRSEFPHLCQNRLDRCWVHLKPFIPAYMDGVEEFMEFVRGK
jgi:hypothetical protein